MEIKIFNKDNLSDKDINEVVTRVKVFLLNKNNEILIANCGGCYMLPGGHVEKNESLISTLKREMLEEAGIVIDDSEIKQPFLDVKTYTKNHRGTTINRLSRIVYFFIESNKVPDLSKLSLTEHEKENNFKLEFIHIDNFENLLQSIINNSPVNIIATIAKETLLAFEELKKNLDIKNLN